MAKLRVLGEKPPPGRGTQENQLRELRDYLYRVNEELEYLLTHLGTDNMDETVRSSAASLRERLAAVEDRGTVITGVPVDGVEVGASNVTVNQAELEAGTYVITACVRNSGNVNGTLVLMITASGVNLAYNRTPMNAGGGNTVCAVTVLEDAAVIRTRASQTSGNNVTLNTNTLTAVKIR